MHKANYFSKEWFIYIIICNHGNYLVYSVDRTWFLVSQAPVTFEFELTYTN